MAEINLEQPVHRFGQTSRKDAWWVKPLIIFLALSAFVVYVTWAAFQGNHYYYGPYLSPLYSPELFGESPHSCLVENPAGGQAGYPGHPPC